MIYRALGGLSIDANANEVGVRPGLSVDLYMARLAAQSLPDPAHKRGCAVNVDAPVGATSLTVDSTAGYRVGDSLGYFLYIAPGNKGGQVELFVAAIPDAVTIVLTYPLVVAVPGGTKFGYQGDQPSWATMVLPSIMKAKRSIWALAQADALAVTGLSSELPLPSAFTPFNAPGALQDTNVGLSFRLPLENPAVMRGYERPLTGPYTLNARLSAAYGGGNVGLYLRNSANAFLVFMLSNGNLYLCTAASASGGVSSYLVTGGFPAEGDLRIQDDGTNLTFTCSTNGFTFLDVAKFGRIANLAGGAVAAGFFASTGYGPSAVALANWTGV